MPLFTYVGPDERLYPDWPVPGHKPGLWGEPGGEPVELDAAPGDGRWVPAPKPAKPAKKDAPSGDVTAAKENG